MCIRDSSGSMMKITCCALTICLINGMPCNLPLFLNFIFVLAICMVDVYKRQPYRLSAPTAVPSPNWRLPQILTDVQKGE